MADKSIVSNSKLTAIANAIRSKTGSTETLTLDTMVTKIQSIGGASSGGTTLKKLLDATKSCYYLFYRYNGTSVEDLISYNDTENVTDMSYMFNRCKSLQTIPLLDTGNVTNTTNMFNSCDKLQTIPQLDTSKVTIMNGMFQNCNNLQTIPQLDTDNVTEMQGTFMYCYKLTTIDITSLDKIGSTNFMYNFACDCHSLTKCIIRTMTKVPLLNTNSFTNCYHFTGTVNSTYNPSGLKDGRIYVPDNMVDSLKSATNWSAYADIIVPLSTLTE